MVTGFDVLGHDRKLRRHWLYRIFAILIDMIIVFFTVGIVLLFLEKNTFWISGITASVSLFVYSVAFETASGHTIGKKLLGLRLRPRTEGSQLVGAVVRNLSKIFWYILLPADVIIGLAMRGDPRQRTLDRMAGTTVAYRKEPDYLGKLAWKTRTKARAPKPDKIKTRKQRPMPVYALEEKCRDCGTSLAPAYGDKARCPECGLIQ